MRTHDLESLRVPLENPIWASLVAMQRTRAANHVFCFSWVGKGISVLKRPRAEPKHRSIAAAAAPPKLAYLAPQVNSTAG